MKSIKIDGMVIPGLFVAIFLVIILFLVLKKK